jgi:hypothetical protein
MQTQYNIQAFLLALYLSNATLYCSTHLPHPRIPMLPHIFARSDLSNKDEALNLARITNEYLPPKEYCEYWSKRYYVSIQNNKKLVICDPNGIVLQDIDLERKKRSHKCRLLTLTITPDDQFISILWSDIFYNNHYISVKTIGITSNFYKELILEGSDRPVLYEQGHISYDFSGNLACYYLQKNHKGRIHYEIKNGKPHRYHKRFYLQFLPLLIIEAQPRPFFGASLRRIS